MPTIPTATGLYASIAYITATIGNTVWQGSGAIIGPHTILTASHVLWDKDANAGASDVTVRLGSSTAAELAGREAWHYNKVDNSGHALTRSDSQADYAVIDVEADLSAYVSFGLKTGYSGGTVHVTGFPSSAQGTLVDDVMTVSADSRYAALNFAAATVRPGESGGPVWIDGGPGHGPSVVGVVSTTSWAAQLTDADVIQIHGWQAEDAFLWAAPKPVALPHAGILTGSFDETYYLAHNPDVAAAGLNGLKHYEQYGWHEGRDPNALFSTSDYLAANRDVAAAGLNPLHHYEEYGWREGRDPSHRFDTSGYLAANPDVAAAHVDPLHHFLQWGMDEGRHGWEI